MRSMLSARQINFIIICICLYASHECKGNGCLALEQEVPPKAISVLNEGGSVYCHHNAPVRYPHFLEQALLEMEMPLPKAIEVTKPNRSTSIRWVFMMHQDDATICAQQLEAIGKLKQLRMLTIVDSAITDESMRQLGGCTRLQHLEIQTCTSGALTLDGLAWIGNLPELRRLDLIGLSIPAEFLAELSDCKKLESLVFTDCTFEDKSLASIEDLTSLKGLSLRHTPLSSEMLAGMARCKSLLSIFLSDCVVEGKTLGPIADLPLLQKLTMQNIDISDDGLSRLAEEPNLNAWLENDMEVWEKTGAKVRRYFTSDDPFGQSGTPRLDIHVPGQRYRGNELPPAEQEIQAKAILVFHKTGAKYAYHVSRSHQFYFQRNEERKPILDPNEIEIAYPKRADPIREVSICLEEDPAVVSRQMKAVGMLKHLASVRIFESSISDDDMKYLAKCPELEVLDIKTCIAGDLTINGLKLIGELPRLKHLTLNCVSLPQSFGAEFQKCQALETLRMLECNGGEHVFEVVGDLKSLKGLFLYGETLSSKSLAHIAGSKSLLAITLQDCELESGTLGPIFAIPSLRHISLHDVFLTEDERRRLSKAKGPSVYQRNGLDIWEKRSCVPNQGQIRGK